MNSAQAQLHQASRDLSDLVMSNIDLKVTCDVTVETIQDATDQLLLSPGEREILSQAVTVLNSISVHYTSIIERLAHGT